MLRSVFIREHWRLIAFGFFMCFCSSFGQTFFISWFGGEIRSAFGLSHGDFGSIYSIATLSSAAVLVWLGRTIDIISLRSFSIAVVVGLSAACSLMATAWSVVALGVAIFGLRLFGQGLVSHASLTAMGRYFTAERGRVISIASLGYNFGEAVFSRLVVAALLVIEWRTVWVIAAVALIVSLPMIFASLNGIDARDRVIKAGRNNGPAAGSDYALTEVLRDPGLWLRLPAIVAPAFIFTGLIFHQVHMATTKGWPPSLVAWSFGLAAAASVLATLVAGPLIDWLSARRLVPYFLIPLIASCLVLYSGNTELTAPVFYGLLGLNSGFGLVLLGAVWPELYGITNLGSIRAFAHAAMVFSSGLAPAFMGLLIDRGITVEDIALGCAIYGIAASALAAAVPRPRRAPA